MLDPAILEGQQPVTEVHHPIAIALAQGGIAVLGGDLPGAGGRVPASDRSSGLIADGKHPTVEVADVGPGGVAEARQRVDLGLNGVHRRANEELEPASVVAAGGVVEPGEACARHGAALGVDGLEERSEVLAQILPKIDLHREFHGVCLRDRVDEVGSLTGAWGKRRSAAHSGRRHRSGGTWNQS
ncbi:MAG: hypothetical protein EXS64_16860 [Candidatus Latescibacteria bacterium]|nr:hypothetical protein [Candidatus Latescibacterota bacterium]